MSKNGGGSGDRLRLLDKTPEQVRRAAEEMGEPAYRARQLCDWVYKKHQVDPGRMSNLPAGFPARFMIMTSRVTQRRDSRDGTVKLLIELEDGPRIESVMIPAAERTTACLSSQAGCAMGCAFCASGLLGLQRNLRSGEILEQVLHLQRESGREITHVVFMGMGEPLANYSAVTGAVRALIDPERFALSARHVTISTVGLPGPIRRLAREKLPINLAVSLHAADDTLRRRLIPSASASPLGEIVEAAQIFRRSRNRRLTLEYTLMHGVNDSRRQAEDLARLALRLGALINLIRFNPVESLPYRPPSDQNLNDFARILEKLGAHVQIRSSRGADADAACGQLRLRHKSPRPT